MGGMENYEPCAHQVLEKITKAVSEAGREYKYPIALRVHFDENAREVRLGGGFFTESPLEGFDSKPMGLNGEKRFYNPFMTDVTLLTLSDEHAWTYRGLHMMRCLQIEFFDLQERAQENQLYDPQRYVFLFNEARKTPQEIEEMDTT